MDHRQTLSGHDGFEIKSLTPISRGYLFTELFGLDLKIENTKARTALVEVDTQLKREKVEALRADRELKERQALLVEAATEVLKRYANGGDMLEADFVVIDQLKEIGLKIPKKLPAKNLKQTNGVR